jgi:membrane protease YdiL (CAAX protease family)
MIYRTPYLEALVLAASAFPSGIVPIFLAIGRSVPSVRIEKRSLTVYCFVLAALVGLVWCISPMVWIVRPANWYYYVVGMLCAPFCIGVEYALMALIMKALTGKWLSEAEVNPLWQVRIAPSTVCLSVCVVALEEVVYRQIVVSEILTLLPMRVSLAIVAQAMMFAMNHLQFGLIPAAVKFPSGIIYGCLYVASGRSLSIPLLAHGLHNLFLMYVSDARRRVN